MNADKTGIIRESTRMKNFLICVHLRKSAAHGFTLSHSAGSFMIAEYSFPGTL